MERVLQGLKPEKVFYYFEELSKIPRGSGNEEAVSNYLYKLAKEKGYEVVQDDAYNIIIHKGATKGYENAPITMLQGHMDMVCEKNEGIEHDFEKDPIKLRIIDNQIYATETTLGADNGIAVAMALAVLEDENAQHPELEVLITVDEEKGMTGVKKLDPKHIRAKWMLNLDSEEEGILTAGCAGGSGIVFKFENKRVKSEYNNAYKISVKGLQGGHSGADIHKEKGNANKILARLLNDLFSSIELVEINGGSKTNAIPREAYAVIKTDDVKKLEEHITKWNAIVKNELEVTDKDVTILCEKTDNSDTVIDKTIARKIISCINIVPVGPLCRSTVIDLVISSNNLGVVSTEEDYIKVYLAPRSSVASLLHEGFIPEMVQLGELLGVETELGESYPGWQFANESKLRDLCAEVYKDVAGKDAVVSAIHAGLECGLLMEKCKNITEAISIGPNMAEIHSPNEHLDIESVGRTYKYLLEILKRIK